MTNTDNAQLDCSFNAIWGTKYIDINSQKLPKYRHLSDTAALMAAHIAWDCLSSRCEHCIALNVYRYHSLDNKVSWEIRRNVQAVSFKVFDDCLSGFIEARVHASNVGQWLAQTKLSVHEAQNLIYPDKNDPHGSQVGAWVSKRWDGRTHRICGLVTLNHEYVLTIRYND
jgi:hypothetical protein